MKAVFRISRIYDFSKSGGIGFFWNGVGRGHVDLQLLTPTGAWIGKFPDWGEKTWVPLKWDELQEVDLDGSRPDKSQITGILWTVHSAGERRLDGIYGLPKGGDPDVYARLIVRGESNKNLKTIFSLRQLTAELKAEFVVEHMVDVYSASGTGNVSTALNSYVDLQGMEITINGVVTGEDLVVLFDATFDPNTGGTGNRRFYVRAVYNYGLGETIIGNESHFHGPYNPYEMKHSLSRRLIAPADGDYTVKIQWKAVDSSTINCNNGLRDMIIMHVH